MGQALSYPAAGLGNLREGMENTVAIRVPCHPWPARPVFPYPNREQLPADTPFVYTPIMALRSQERQGLPTSLL